MHKRILGRGPLEVSALGIGCWGMSHAYGPADEREASATLDAALEHGISFFDTADIYGNGHNEQLVGRALRGRRDRVVLATKFGFVGAEGGPLAVDGRPERVRAACDASLQRLGVDVIDLYYLHRYDRSIPIEDTVGAMAELVRSGKVRYLGLSEVSAQTLRRAHAVHPVTALQSEYSLWTRDVEAGVLPACRELGVTLVAFSPLGRGFLTGRIRSRDDLAPEDFRRALPRFDEANLRHNLQVVAGLRELAAARGTTPAQMALAWLLARGRDIIPIPGMTRRASLLENIAAADLQLSAADLAHLDELASLVHGARYGANNLRFVES